MHLNYLGCCGIKELANIHGVKPKEILRRFGSHMGYVEWQTACNRTSTTGTVVTRATTSPRCAFIVFSEAGPRAAYGRRLAEFIEANNLGTVTRVAEERNPNSGRIVRPYVWSINLANFKKWFKDQNISEEELTRLQTQFYGSRPPQPY